MRSRYSAYAKGLADYIMLTTHPFAISLDRQQWRKTIEQFCLHTHFVKLEILEFMENPQTATVTFVATLLQGSKDVSFKEKSLFEMVHHRWLYLSGEVEPLSSPKNSV
jgi:SEC-C motif-containing protein